MKLKGSIVALVTPMDQAGRIDFAALTRLLEFHIAQGTHGIVAVGTTGESATLSVDEHLATIEHVIKVVQDRVPVLAGTGANSTHEAIFLTTEAAALGADAALLVVPYYNKPTQEGLYQHFRAIAESVDIAQILYNVPGRTVADLDLATVQQLADIDNIIGIKDATGDLERGKKLIDACADRLSILSGDDPTALAYMKLGAQGDISVTANVAPKLMSQLCDFALAGDFAAADKIDGQLADLHRDLFLQSNPIPVKYAVSKLGYTTNALRLPLTPLSEEYEAVVDAAMRAAGISV